MCFTFLPTIFFSINWGATGEKFASPYSTFTTDQPQFNELVGTYTLNNKKSSTGISDNDKKNISTIVLNADSTFEMKNIPVHGFLGYETYELWIGKGTWTTRKDNDNWVVWVHPDTLMTVDNKPTFKDGFFTNDFAICNDKPPYNLYQIIGDPDEWTGALYERHK